MMPERISLDQPQLSHSHPARSDSARSGRGLDQRWYQLSCKPIANVSGPASARPDLLILFSPQSVPLSILERSSSDDRCRVHLRGLRDRRRSACLLLGNTVGTNVSLLRSPSRGCLHRGRHQPELNNQCSPALAERRSSSCVSSWERTARVGPVCPGHHPAIPHAARRHAGHHLATRQDMGRHPGHRPAMRRVAGRHPGHHLAPRRGRHLGHHPATPHAARRHPGHHPATPHAARRHPGHHPATPHAARRHPGQRLAGRQRSTSRDATPAPPPVCSETDGAGMEPSESPAPFALRWLDPASDELSLRFPSMRRASNDLINTTK